MASVSLKKIEKSYGENLIVKGIDLEVGESEFVVLVGPSGCGKSTTLRMIAGLEEISAGSLIINERDCTFVSASERGVAMVFQDYALYPHMSVFENIAFGLRLKKFSEDEINARVGKAATILGLTPVLERKPAALSGGQRQRVAMGRAFVKQTGVYLFDEPLSNLDAKLRAKMRLEMKKFHREAGGSIIYVTHDQLEAMTLADRIVVMNGGQIEQVGSPLEVFDCPKTQFVASFIGSPQMNFLSGKIVTSSGRFQFECEQSKMRFDLPEGKFPNLIADQEVTLGLRPSDLYISVDDHFPNWQMKAQVEFVELLGKNAYITFEAEGVSLVGEVMGRDIPAIGSAKNLTLNLNHAHLFDAKTKRNLIWS